MIQFILNDENISTPSSAGSVLLDFLRHEKKLTGTKESCREGDCGACTVLIGEYVGRENVRYYPVTSCIFPLGDACGKHVVTIEGLKQKTLSPIQQAFIDQGATQCGFCTPGFIMSLTAYFLYCNEINIDDAMQAVDGNICRCTGYISIKRAIEQICFQFNEEEKNNFSNKNSPARISLLVEKGIVPDYFKQIPDRLQKLAENLATKSKKDITAPVLVAGGTDLYVQRPDELKEKNMSFVSQKELNNLWNDNDYSYIGAGANIEAIRKFEPLRNQVPGLDRYFHLISSTPIRYRATLGGNLVNASPIGDLIIFFLALNAQLSLFDGENRRKIYLKDFYKGYKELDKKENEILEHVIFPTIKENTKFNFEKVSKRQYLDIASVNSAMMIRTVNDRIEEIHLSAGGVSPVPLYLSKTVDFLLGKELTAANINRAAEIMNQEISPISDIRGSATYKRVLLRQLLFTHFITLFPDRDISL